MTVLLQPKITRKLVRLPESGMGYQIVDLLLEDGGRIDKVTVVNADTVLLSGAQTIDPEAIADIQLSA
jgi:hypothetical protein